jgi:hypothetical protein
MPASNSPSLKSQDTFTRRQRQSSRRMLVAGAAACALFAIFLATWKLFGTSRGDNDNIVQQTDSTESTSSSSGVTAPRGNAMTTSTEVAAESFTLVDDDGKTLWDSPTHGEPLLLAYLPPGMQVIVALRPRALATHAEGEKVLDSLGPLGQRGMEFLSDLRLEPRELQQLIVGLNVTSDGKWHSTIVARLNGHASADDYLRDKLPDAVQKSTAGSKYLLANDWAYFVPHDHRNVMVVASERLIAEVIELRGDPPPLRREIERLVSRTDADCHFTMIIAPSFLFGEGHDIFRRQMAPLREPLFTLLGDEFGAAALSMHWDKEDFFVELLAVPTLDVSAGRAAQLLAERVAQVPDALEEYIVRLEPHRYGRRVIARLPAMVRKLAAYTRSGFDNDHAVLRCYLPTVAGHNLLMASELTLAETLNAAESTIAAESPESLVTTRQGSPKSVATTPSSANEQLDLSERLRTNTSLVLPRDTLEAALEQLSRDIDIEIVIAGSDLQAEGITKNQSFGIDMSNRPAEEILVEILRLANPDKTAAGPNDPRQKLVYVIAADDGKPARIVITTRAAAAARNDEFPAVFRPK